jgi:hypothetical protein
MGETALPVAHAADHLIKKKESVQTVADTTSQQYFTQYCGSGSGAFLILGSGIGKKSKSGCGMNIPDHISESLKLNFWVKNTLIL